MQCCVLLVFGYLVPFRWRQYLDEDDHDVPDPLIKLVPAPDEDILITPLPLKETLRGRWNAEVRTIDTDDVTTCDLMSNRYTASESDQLLELRACELPTELAGEDAEKTTLELGKLFVKEEESANKQLDQPLPNENSTSSFTDKSFDPNVIVRTASDECPNTELRDESDEQTSEVKTGFEDKPTNIMTGNKASEGGHMCTDKHHTDELKSIEKAPINEDTTIHRPNTRCRAKMLRNKM